MAIDHRRCSAAGWTRAWTFYTPFSSTYTNSAVVLVIVGIFINGFSSIFTGLNFIITIHTMRAPGLNWFRLPLFIWSNYATSVILVLATPVLAITLTLVGVERLWHVGIFDPALGGDPILFQHLFWFYSHPAVYLMVLLPGDEGVVERDHSVLLLRASRSLATSSSRSPASRSRFSVFSSGGTTCSSRARAYTPGCFSRC